MWRSSVYFSVFPVIHLLFFLFIRHHHVAFPVTPKCLISFASEVGQGIKKDPLASYHAETSSCHRPCRHGRLKWQDRLPLWCLCCTPVHLHERSCPCYQVNMLQANDRRQQDLGNKSSHLRRQLGEFSSPYRSLALLFQSVCRLGSTQAIYVEECALMSPFVHAMEKISINTAWCFCSTTSSLWSLASACCSSSILASSGWIQSFQ